MRYRGYQSKTNTQIFNTDFTPMYYVKQEIDSVDWKIVQIETMRDPILKQVLLYVKDGWPNETPKKLRGFKNKKNELSIENNCLFWGIRIIIPESLRPTILRELHMSHAWAW